MNLTVSGNGRPHCNADSTGNKNNTRNTMTDNKKLGEFTQEYRRIRTEMQQQIGQVRGDAFLVATLALQYAVVSLQMQGYTRAQVIELAENLPISDPNQPKTKLN
tara:strand:+ start:129 stop:443 length:315 start_codon:yes stop_codon:yes gene_type:complete